MMKDNCWDDEIVLAIELSQHRVGANETQS